MNKKLITFLILYLIFGIIYQSYTCYVSIKDDSISCVNIVWTPIIILGWPLFGIFDLISGPIVRGVITLIAFSLAILVPHLVFKTKTY